MRSSALSLAALLAVLGSGACAQSAMDRAAAAADGAADTGNTFKDSTISEVVTPFETANPDEAGMSHATFEDRILDVRNADNDQGRVLRATEDSAVVRPDVDIDGQGPLFDDANWAHENADDIAGQYFSSETGACTTPEVPVSDIRDEFCESLPARENRTCDLIRRIWVDRTDFYRCDNRASNYVKVCEQDVTYNCSRQSNCVRSNVKFSGVSSEVWDGDTVTVTVRGTGQHTVPGLVQETLKVQISDQFAPDEVRVSRVDANGFVQLLDHRGVLETFAPEELKRASSSGGTCPSGPDDGLLVPLTKYGVETSRASCRPAPDKHYAVITKTPITRNHRYRGRWFKLPENTGPTVFESGWEITSPFRLLYHVKYDHPGGSSDRDYPTCITRYTYGDMHCYLIAPLRQGQSFNRNTLRWLDLNFYQSADPETGKRYFTNDLTVSMVTLPGQEQNAEVRIKIEFTGSCCNSFTKEVSERCE